MGISLEAFSRQVNTVVLGMLGRARGLISEIALEEGLSHQQAMLLMYLGEIGPSPMGDISHFLGTTQGVVTRMVDRLVDRGLVLRERHSDDRRVVLVSLSDRGNVLAEKMTAMRLAETNSFCSMVEEDDREIFLQLLNRLSEQFEAGPHQHPEPESGGLEKGKTRC